MFKKQFLVCLLTVFGWLQIGPVSAATLGFNPASTNIVEGKFAYSESTRI